MAGTYINIILLLISLTGSMTTVVAQNDTTAATTAGTTGGTTAMTTGGTVTMDTTMGTTMDVSTSQASTDAPVTPPNIPIFTATEHGGGAVCMIIALEATMTVDRVGGEPVTTEVPIDADIIRSPAECPDTAKTSFMELFWQDNDDMLFTLYMSFEMMEDEYTMNLINGSMITEEGNETVLYSWEQTEGLHFSHVSVGDAIHCKDVALNNIEFQEYQFQPFAQNSGGNFGDVMECGDEGMETMWIIIISVVCGLALIAVIGGGAWFCNRRRKASNYESV